MISPIWNANKNKAKQDTKTCPKHDNTYVTIAIVPRKKYNTGTNPEN